MFTVPCKYKYNNNTSKSPYIILISQSTKACMVSLSVENVHMTIYCIHFRAEIFFTEAQTSGEKLESHS
jgi:hypothetical protein